MFELGSGAIFSPREPVWIPRAAPQFKRLGGGTKNGGGPVFFIALLGIKMFTQIAFGDIFGGLIENCF